ncbi:hypothetical protein GURASL_09480 [Geotalea uraniireducens]|uniref:Lipopolysaccharide assembly protein A domain-containing protein n=1 Tax=Geotalea uraniireducens TaxID=351604 RepID=A0ABN6VP67_9BACT|nr:LapA family protein [Geotalea uraniireducens]BDV42025.1 hypothetical protein GURASL_09480 [Geotalea uraniireducens]
MTPTIVIATLIALFTMIFSVQNAQSVELSLFAWRFAGPLAAIILLAFAAGALTAWLTGLPSRLRLRKELREALQREEALKSQPPADNDSR